MTEYERSSSPEPTSPARTRPDPSPWADPEPAAPPPGGPPPRFGSGSAAVPPPAFGSAGPPSGPPRPGGEQPAGTQPGFGSAPPEFRFGTQPPPDPPYGPGAAPAPGYPGYPGQPGWGPPVPVPMPAGGQPGSRAVSVLMVLGLMVLAAVGGGAAGAWLYAQNGDGGGGATIGGTTVVDAPQLDYTSLASIASAVSPSVVQIAAGDGSGSGVVMSDEGYILTNAHVVAVATGDQVTVRFSNGETEPATIVGADARTDIAVVRARDAGDLTPATFGDSDQVLVGDTVLAIGSPLGFQGSVTQGIVSARDRTLPVDGDTPGQRRSLSGLLQTDASINPGNSGGPLVNLAGKVVGINTAIATDGQANGFLGLGFAVPSNRASEVADQLIAGEAVSHAYLGVEVQNVVGTPGAVITGVVPDSPADAAGLREGDIIVGAGGDPITSASDIVNAVQAAEPGDALEIEFERDGVRDTTTVTLAEAGD
jgi:putative serine protease PepD